MHLQKGCYRGQETVARVHNLGRPPRRLVLLHLDGPATTAAAAGRRCRRRGRARGRPRDRRRHHELGPVALALVKRSAVTAAPGSELWVAAEGDDGAPGPAAVDPDSVPPDTGEPPGGPRCGACRDDGAGPARS